MNDSRSARWPWVLGVGCLLLLVVGLLSRRRGEISPSTADATVASTVANAGADRGLARLPRARRHSVMTAEEIVSSKVRQCARLRREYAYELARRANKPVPKEVEEFFDALEGGNWEEIEARFKALRGGDPKDTPVPPHLYDVWPAIHDAYGAAQEAHLWPAQKLLDYGNAVLDSLRPGMVYVGGTDPGRWIPALLNDTRDGERHIVLT